MFQLQPSDMVNHIATPPGPFCPHPRTVDGCEFDFHFLLLCSLNDLKQSQSSSCSPVPHPHPPGQQSYIQSSGCMLCHGKLREHSPSQTEVLGSALKGTSVSFLPFTFLRWDSDTMSYRVMDRYKDLLVSSLQLLSQLWARWLSLLLAGMK